MTNKEEHEVAALALSLTKACIVNDLDTAKLCREEIKKSSPVVMIRALDAVVSFTAASLHEAMDCEVHGSDHIVSRIEKTIASIHAEE